MKRGQKEIIVRIKKYLEWHIWKFQKLKITPKTFKHSKFHVSRPQMKKIQQTN